MNTPSASPAEPRPAKVLVWDWPVRIFHWLLVASFAGAWVTAESERWQLVHITLGYTVAGLVAFRVVWGLVGTRPARFSSFVRGPAAIGRYVAGELRGTTAPPTGHNPVGAIAIVAMLALAAGVAATGWASYNELGGHWLEELHEGAAATLLGVAIVHVAGVVLASLLHRENLVRAMITGRKRGQAEEGARRPWRAVGALLLAAVLGFWTLQWTSATAPMTGGAALLQRDAHGSDD
jgi:cytochrome b